VSPVSVSFATPTDVDHGGGYDVKLVDGTITVTEFVDSRTILLCPADDGYACLQDDHHLIDQAGTWEIKY
jgi:hypothetical protein